MQLRNVKRCYFFNTAIARLKKKYPQYANVSDAATFALYLVYSIQPARQTYIVSKGKQHKRTIAELQLGELARLNLVERERVSHKTTYYRTTPAGIHYLQLLDKYIKESRIDR